MGPSSYNNSPCPAWLPQHTDPETQRGKLGSNSGLLLPSPYPLRNCPPRGLAPPALPGLPPFPLLGLFIGPGSGASRTRGARAQDCLTGPSPGAPQPGQCPLSVQQSKRPVTQSDQWGWGGQAEVGAGLGPDPGPGEPFAVHREAGLPRHFGDSVGQGACTGGLRGHQPLLGKA